MYNKLILSFTIFIIILYSYYSYEGFTDKENIISNKNLFIKQNETINLENININRLCISDAPGDEPVCITKEQLFNALDLPIFRKHSVCIDDACITRNNLKKIIGEENVNLKPASNDSKCVNVKKIPAALSTITKKRWQTDRKGDREGDENARLFSSLYEPKGGWVSKPKDYCRYKHTTEEHKLNAPAGKKPGGPCDKKKFPNKGFCQRGYGNYDYNSILKYGCSANHRSSPNVCWESAGHRCKRARNDRRRLNKSKKPLKQGSIIDGGVSTFNESNCDDDSDFKIHSGSIIDEFNLLNNPYKITNYSKVAKHFSHNI